MGKNDASIKKGIPFYIAGFACIATGLFYLSTYLVSSWYYTLLAVVAFVAGGLMWYLGWLMHMGMDTKDFDNDGSGTKSIFLDKPV
jgi:hypothetical protein